MITTEPTKVEPPASGRVSVPALRLYRKIQSSAAAIDPDTREPLGYCPARREKMAEWLDVTERRVLQLLQELRAADYIQMSRVGRRTYPRPLVACPPPPKAPKPTFTRPAVLASTLKPRRHVSPISSPVASPDSAPVLPCSSGSGATGIAKQQQAPTEPEPAALVPLVVASKPTEGVERAAKPSHTTPPTQAPQATPALLTEMQRRGLSMEAAQALLERHGEARCREAIRVFDDRKQPPDRPGGFLRRAIEEGWSLPAQDTPPEPATPSPTPPRSNRRLPAFYHRLYGGAP